MAQYIPKGTLIAEIERRVKNLYPKGGQGMVVTKILKDHYEDLLSFINTLEVIDADLQEEPISEDLGEYINELSNQFPEVSFAKLSRIAVRVAKWQEKQDQKTIELAEDHAMLAGMEKAENLKKLADAMYNAAQNMTTDASRLRMAMDEYHQYVIHNTYGK